MGGMSSTYCQTDIYQLSSHLGPQQIWVSNPEPDLQKQSIMDVAGSIILDQKRQISVLEDLLFQVNSDRYCI